MKYIVKYNVADQELEKVLNEQQGYTIKEMFRNKTSDSGMETTTVIFEQVVISITDYTQHTWASVAEINNGT